METQKSSWEKYNAALAGATTNYEHVTNVPEGVILPERIACRLFSSDGHRIIISLDGEVYDSTGKHWGIAPSFERYLCFCIN